MAKPVAMKELKPYECGPFSFGGKDANAHYDRHLVLDHHGRGDPA